jgi:hypothetical protein
VNRRSVIKRGKTDRKRTLTLQRRYREEIADDIRRLEALMALEPEIYGGGCACCFPVTSDTRGETASETSYNALCNG